MPFDMKHRLRVGKVMTVGFVTAGDDPEAELVFFKSRDPDHGGGGASDDPDNNGGSNMPEFDKTKLDDAARAELERLEQVAKDAEAAQATAEGERDEAVTAKTAAEEALAEASDEGGEGDDVTKGMSPEVKDAFEKQQADLDEARDEIRKEREQRQRDAMAIRFAKGGDLEQIGGEDRTDVLLKAQQTLDAEDWAKLDTLLTAAAKQIAEGELLKEAGRDGEGGDGVEGEAEREFLGLVDKAMEADSDLSERQARVQVMKANSALYQKVRTEQREANEA